MDEHRQDTTEEPRGRAGLVALVGRANVGKSSLLNRLLGEKVSIVSPIAQTTRNLIRGILTEPRGQLAFLDTPGVHRASADLGRLMNRIARASVKGVDAVALVLDRSVPPGEEDEGWMRRMLRREPGTRLFAVLNKVDRAGGHAAAYRALWERLAAAGEGAGAAAVSAPAWLEVSALAGTGTGELLDTLFSAMPVHPPLFPEDVLTDFPRKLAMADIIREKLLGRLHSELPHRVAVEVDDIADDGKTLRVSATIFVERESQKGIVIGQKGRLLRAVRRASQRELEAIYERSAAVVEVRVKVEPHWTRNFWFLKRLGYAT